MAEPEAVVPGRDQLMLHASAQGGGDHVVATHHEAEHRPVEPPSEHRRRPDHTACLGVEGLEPTADRVGKRRRYTRRDRACGLPAAIPLDQHAIFQEAREYLLNEERDALSTCGKK